MRANNIYWNLINFDNLDSTNDYARNLALEGSLEGTVVVAKSQSKGRGRRGRSWHSPKGNLYFSILLKFENNVENMGQLSFVASTALADTINEMAQETKVLCKWPNDIITLDYKKIAGILIETTGTALNDFAILGIGVNIKDYPKEIEVNISASSLLEQGIKITSKTMLKLFLKHLEKQLFVWRKDGFAPIRTEWLKNAYGIESYIEIRLPKQTFKGIFKGIDEKGAILFENQDGELQKIASGEVFFK